MLGFGMASDSQAGVLPLDFAGFMSRSRTSLSSFGRGRVVISWRDPSVSHATLIAKRDFAGRAYLERLRVPFRHLFDRGHFVETIGEFFELLDAVGEADGELLGEELGGAEEGSWGRG